MFEFNVLSLISVLLLIIGSPLLFGIINKTKAFFAGRIGQPLLQPYYNLFKLFQKGTVYSTTTTFIFRLGSVIVVASCIMISLILPLGPIPAVISFSGDLFLVIYLLGLIRFFMVISALDTGSSFEGMGASRETFFSALTEPILMLALLALAKNAESLSLAKIMSEAHTMNIISTMLIGIGLLGVILAENARIPVDDPNTHLELTMIHEVMILDHSGVELGLMALASSMKLWLTSILFIRVLIPLRMDTFIADLSITLGLIVVVAFVIGILESRMARMKLIRLPHFFVSAFILVLLGFFFGVIF